MLRPLTDEPDSLRRGLTPMNAANALALRKPAHITDMGEELGDGDVAQARNAADQFGILAKSRMSVDVIVDLLLQRLGFVCSHCRCPCTEPISSVAQYLKAGRSRDEGVSREPTGKSATA